KAVPRGGREPARIPGTALYRGGSGRASHSLLAAGWPACHGALGHQRSGESLHKRLGGAAEFAGVTGARPARIGVTPGAGCTALDPQRPCSSGSGTSLQPDPETLSAGGRHSATLLVVARAMG